MRPFTILLLIVLGCPLAAELRVAPAEALQPSAAGYVHGPRIAASASGFLVAWIDQRPPADERWHSEEGHVRAMRLDANGERLDERDFELAPLTQGAITVASDGRDYLVAYRRIDDRDRAFVRLVLVPGTRGEAPRFVRELEGYGGELVWTGSHYVLLAGRTLHLLDRAGAVVDRVPLGLSWWQLKLLGTRDGRLLIAHREIDGTCRVALVNVEDLPRDERLHELPGAVELPGGRSEGMRNVAEGAFGFAVLKWNGFTASAVFLDRDARNPSPLVPLDEGPWYLGIERLGTGYVVMASADGGMSLTRFTRDGKRLHGGTELLDEVNPWSLATAPAAGGTAMLAYEAGIGEVRVQRLALGGTPMLPEPGVVASVSRVTQEDARVARCASFDAVVWLEPEGASKRVMLRRFAHDGPPLGPPVKLDTTIAPYPAIVCGRTNALIHWTHHQPGPDWMVQAGVLIGPKTISPRITLEVRNPLSVVFDGESYVGVSAGRPLRLIRWNEEGVQTAEKPHVLLPDYLRLQYPRALGWNGEEFLLVVQMDARLYGYRFGSDLSFAGFTNLIAGVQWPSASEYYDLAVAGSPGVWLVAWDHARTTRTFIPTTARLYRDGTLLLDPPGGVPIGGRIIAGMRQLSWNGAQWELVTQDGVLSRDPGGFASMLRLADEGILLHGITASGDSRRIVYQRVEPVDGVHELYTDIIDGQAWVEGPRRRSSRH